MECGLCTTPGWAAKIPSTSVKFSYKSALVPAAIKEPVISDPPLEKVQMSLSSVTPKNPGTKVTLTHTSPGLPVVGIAGDDHFVSINISKYLMNREIGFGRKVLQLLEELNMRWEHIPTGIDDMSIVLRDRELTPEKEAKIIRYLKDELHVDDLEIEKDLSIIMLVGENMKNHIGITASATKALSEKQINLEMISQGSSEVSIMFVIKSEQEKEAIQALYTEFFPTTSTNELLTVDSKG